MKNDNVPTDANVAEIEEIVKAVKGFKLVFITILGLVSSVIALPYVHPVKQLTVSDVEDLLRREGERYARPNKWTSIDAARDRETLEKEISRLDRRLTNLEWHVNQHMIRSK